MRFSLFRLTALAPVLLSACSPAGVLNALAPRSGIVVTHDLAYASGSRHGVDVYAPATARAAPVVVFFYGGGWISGARQDYRFVGAALARHGIIAVIPDYRLYPEVRFPAFLQDGAAAIAWTHANVARYGGDPSRLFLMGHSAGAYIAAMLTLDRTWLGAEGLNPDRVVSGTIGLAGPYDFLPIPMAQAPIFASAADARITQPISFARGDAPPLLLATGDEDQTVRPANSLNLAKAIIRDGGRADVRTYRDIGHLKIIGTVSGLLRWLAPVLPDTLAFIQSITARDPS